MTKTYSCPPAGWAVLAVLAACGDDGAAPGPDAALLADNGVATCGKPVVYLDFTGATITLAAADDATRDQGINFGFTAQPVADAGWVATVEGDVFARLAALSIPATRTRPTSGEYTMVVFDDDVSDWPGGTASSPPSLATIDCGDANPHNLQRINVRGHAGLGSPHVAAHSVMFVLGVGAGLDVVSSAVDADNCLIVDRLVEDCQLVGDVMTTGRACSVTRQDQRALLTAALGCP
jgi:hypothetical protein